MTVFPDFFFIPGNDPERSEEDRDLPFLNENSVSFSEFLGGASDSHFRQLAEKGDLLDHIDFPDVLLHSKGAAATPEKQKRHESDKPPTSGKSSAPDVSDIIHGHVRAN